MALYCTYVGVPAGSDNSLRMRYAASLAAFGLDSALSTMAGRWTNSFPCCCCVSGIDLTSQREGTAYICWVATGFAKRILLGQLAPCLCTRLDPVRTTSLMIFPSGESSGKAAAGVALNVEPGVCGELRVWVVWWSVVPHLLGRRLRDPIMRFMVRCQRTREKMEEETEDVI